MRQIGQSLPRWTLRRLSLAAVLLIPSLLLSCGGNASSEPLGTSDQASGGSCPVTIDIPTQHEATGPAIQIAVRQSCSNWTHSMIAYIDGQRCDEAPYPFPNAGCVTKDGAQNFATSTWLQVAAGTHTLDVNNWDSKGAVGVSSPLTFTYTPEGKDGGTGQKDAASDAHLPPGTISFTDLDQHMFKIANGASDHCTTLSGHEYCGGSCNGSCAGSGALSSYSIQTSILDQALVGSSSRVDVSGAGTDTLEWVKLDPSPKGSGPYKSDTHFVWDLYFYPTTTKSVQAYEFDAFYGANGWWLMMGTQCDLSTGNWNGWNQATGHWVPSAIEDCGSFFHVNSWNHIVFHFHRDPGNVSASTRYYYDGLEVNGVSHAWGLGGFTGTENGWGDVVGAQVQQDLTGAFPGTLSTYYDAFTFEVSP